MKVKEISHFELVNLCCQESQNRNAWIEFCSRYDEHIWSVVFRECEEKNIFNNFSLSKQVVKDLVQEVYMKLVDNEKKALRDFQGAYKNSIYLYLGTIAKNVVRNYFVKMGAQKRPQIYGSLDDVVVVSDDGEKIHVIDQIESKQHNVEDKLKLKILEEEIDEILDKFLRGRTKQRNKIVFKLHFYEGLTAEEISTQFNFEISESRVINLISEIKVLLRKELLKKKIVLKRKDVKNIKKFCLVY
ncbi:sigma-70 family RNA polymerase sigma factor [candidate division KSB1 bacterium]|nr:sigma-70 family RNA polymerase sigma factor [candidate division KSB1 bacterium]MBL7095337.1 sigma-70 family RNA polymerase sigma factor [candidate division KSB1 bacterium]